MYCCRNSEADVWNVMKFAIDQTGIAAANTIQDGMELLEVIPAKNGVTITM